MTPHRTRDCIVATVICTTYNHPEWLRKVLRGFAAQDRRDFEVIVADDGSGPKTKEVIEELRSAMPFMLRHVWQPDKGFQKCRILNKAIAIANSDYLIVTDGDCIVRADFVSSHLRLRERGRFLSGGYFKLPMSLSQAISDEDIASGRCFGLGWLHRHGLKKNVRNLRLATGQWSAALLDRFTTARQSWNGHNASGWRDDIVRINGFDERMGYGGEDVELGERLANAGIVGKRIRYQTGVLHLDHARSYDRPEVKAVNGTIRARVREEKLAWTDFGLRSVQSLSKQSASPEKTT